MSESDQIYQRRAATLLGAKILVNLGTPRAIALIKKIPDQDLRKAALKGAEHVCMDGSQSCKQLQLEIQAEEYQADPGNRDRQDDYAYAAAKAEQSGIITSETYEKILQPLGWDPNEMLQSLEDFKGPFPAPITVVYEGVRTACREEYLAILGELVKDIRSMRNTMKIPDDFGMDVG